MTDDEIKAEAKKVVVYYAAGGALIGNIEIAMRKVRDAEREACAKIADRCADDEMRKALGANATINASQIASAIRARSNT